MTLPSLRVISDMGNQNHTFRPESMPKYQLIHDYVDKEMISEVPILH